MEGNRMASSIQWARIVAAGAGCVVLAGCGAGIQDLPLGRSASATAYDVTVQLATADGLVLGADVRNGQKVIGRVAELRPDQVGAAVRLSLDSTVPLPENVEAAVELPSALGSPFIRLTAPDDPSSRPLRNGDVVPESRTEIGPQVETALATLGTVLTGSGISQLDTIVRELNVAFAGRSGDVRSLTRTMTDLMASASRHQDDFDRAMVLATRVSGQLTAQQQVVDGYLDVVPPVIDVLLRQKDAIASLLNSTAQLAVNANSVLAQSPTGMDAMLSDASTVVGALDSFNDRIGGTLTNMNTFLETFQTAVRGDYLVFDGALDIPGGIDKLLTGGMFLGSNAAPPLETLEDLLTGGAR
ncbi:MCE family protein [Rhodococcus triatomae]|uniref:Phospholipid/cholesterol/gamma-HCH transport system substrate-binding protein n=1 Tax=Rhodococcus triatomae TaxID=300028 RepID=A0A1G8RCX9_9NOCA|nr:MCE family protein [Rhodococcus triatomae]QNG19644.1 MCE family protein [Rhodococcus triatomae]QNG24441.1 MCE family protein [Rhodococcus triatomae]SDJ14852.1 phospholipid/cholesterol/gamma-HCH transport system substrate-binding protein [Rhodococcus triatomae]